LNSGKENKKVKMSVLTERETGRFHFQSSYAKRRLDSSFYWRTLFPPIRYFL